MRSISWRAYGLLVAGVVVWPLFAAPSAAAQEPAVERLCSIRDERLTELSGMVADEERIYATNDGGTRIEIFVLRHDCTTERVITAESDPFDVEDLARAADGTFWLADTGDNRKQRETVALHAVRPDGTTTLHRLRYPDGAHDAEALLLDGAGTPHIITKNVLGKSGVYRPVSPLATPGPVDLESVGSLSLDVTDTPGGPVGSIGSMLITGAAATSDGSVVALRTYTDAYLYAVPDGDVVAALGREPVRVPLPDEQQGEAIAFAADGALLSASEGVGQPLRSVAGAAGLVSRAPGEPGDEAPSAGSGGGSVTADDDGLPLFPGALLALLLATAGYYGVRALLRR